MADANKMNGSADLLAKAMRQAFSEAVEAGLVPVEERLKGQMEEGFADVNRRIDGVEERLPKPE